MLYPPICATYLFYVISYIMYMNLPTCNENLFEIADLAVNNFFSCLTWNAQFQTNYAARERRRALDGRTDGLHVR